MTNSLVSRLIALKAERREIYDVAGDEVDECLQAAADHIESLESQCARLEQENAQARVDILCVLGACRDNMPSEAVAIFQRIAKDLSASLHPNGGGE